MYHVLAQLARQRSRARSRDHTVHTLYTANYIPVAARPRRSHGQRNTERRPTCSPSFTSRLRCVHAPLQHGATRNTASVDPKEGWRHSPLPKAYRSPPESMGARSTCSTAQTAARAWTPQLPPRGSLEARTRSFLVAPWHARPPSSRRPRGEPGRHVPPPSGRPSSRAALSASSPRARRRRGRGSRSNPSSPRRRGPRRTP